MYRESKTAETASRSDADSIYWERKTIMTEKHETHHGAGHDTRPVWMQEMGGIALRVQANPLPYAAGVLVILASLAAGGVYQLLQAAKAKDASTDFAAAAFVEDEAARLAALEEVAGKHHAWSDEALYLVAEDRLAKKELDAAAQAYQQILSSYPDSEWAPRAAEGLAYIDELNDVLIDAVTGYERVRDQWPDSYAARLQPYNIARACESMGDMERAVKEYQNQLTVFPESKVAEKAQMALDRIRGTHPALFSDAPADAAAPAAPAAEAAPAESAPAVATPAEAAPEASAPAEAAPAESTPAEMPAPDSAETPAPETAGQPESGGAS